MGREIYCLQMKTQKTEVKSPPSPPLLTGQFPDLSQTQTQLSSAGEKPEVTAPPLIRSFKKKKKKEEHRGPISSQPDLLSKHQHCCYRIHKSKSIRLPVLTIETLEREEKKDCCCFFFSTNCISIYIHMKVYILVVV